MIHKLLDLRVFCWRILLFEGGGKHRELQVTQRWPGKVSLKLLKGKSLKLKKKKAKPYAHLQLSSIFFYEHRLSFYSYKNSFLSFQSVHSLHKDPPLSLSTEEEMDYSHHYLTLGKMLLFPTSQEQKQCWNIIIKTWIIYWVGPVLNQEKSVRRKERQRKSVMYKPQSPSPTEEGRGGRKVSSEQMKLSLWIGSGWEKGVLRFSWLSPFYLFFFLCN